MPSLKAIRTRIASVKNTQKITKAMKLVAAARLRKAQDAIIAQRPYAQRLGDVVADLVARIDRTPDEATHPLLIEREEHKILLLVLTSDRGLAGGFNSNLLRKAERFIVDNQEKYERIGLVVLGRKGREYLRRRKYELDAELPGPSGVTAEREAEELAARATEAYLSGTYDGVYLVYNQFKSAISQVGTIERLLPLRSSELPETAGKIDFEYEPSKAEVVGTIVPLYLRISIYRALLESVASEFGARMSAMDSATKNAKEMIGRLTLDFNRARQAAITKELMEIVGGAEALKG